MLLRARGDGERSGAAVTFCRRSRERLVMGGSSGGARCVRGAAARVRLRTSPPDLLTRTYE